MPSSEDIKSKDIIPIVTDDTVINHPSSQEDLAPDHLLRCLIAEIKNPGPGFARLLSLLKQMKLFCDKQSFEQTIFNNKDKLQEAIQLLATEIDINQCYIMLDNIALFQKSQTNLLDRSIPSDQHAFLKLMTWLQEIFIQLAILKQPEYQLALKTVTDLKQQSTLAKSDKIYRMTVAALTGVGTATTVLNWGPMAIIGCLGFIGCAVPPAGITILAILFGAASIVLATMLVYNLISSYRTEDKNHALVIQKMEKKIHRLAKKDASLEIKKHYLNNKYLQLRKTVDPTYQVNLPEVNSLLSEPFMPIIKKTPVSWPRMVMGTLGAVGLTWGIPNLILGFCGISLIVGGALSGPGIALVILAVAFAAVFTYKAYQYEKKYSVRQDNLQHLKGECLSTIKKKIEFKEKQINTLKLDIKNLKQENKHTKSTEIALSKIPAPESPKLEIKVPPIVEVCKENNFFSKKEDLSQINKIEETPSNKVIEEQPIVISCQA